MRGRTEGGVRRSHEEEGGRKMRKEEEGGPGTKKTEEGRRRVAKLDLAVTRLRSEFWRIQVWV